MPGRGASCLTISHNRGRALFCVATPLGLRPGQAGGILGHSDATPLRFVAYYERFSDTLLKEGSEDRVKAGLHRHPSCGASPERSAKADHWPQAPKGWRLGRALGVALPVTTW